MRLFIGIDFDALRDYFINIQKQIKVEGKIKFTTSFHLTLKFLGEVPDLLVNKIREKLSEIKFKPFTVALNKIGVFPNEDYIRVIWIGLKDSQKVIELQQKIDKQLYGMFKMDKKFHPHITIARVKFITNKEGLIKNLKAIKIKEIGFEVDKFQLVKSILTQQGPIYKVLEEYKF